MLTVWTGNGQTQAQVETIALTAVATGAVYTAQVSDKTVSYTATGTDTTATAAAAWQALLNSGTAPLEFQDIAFSVATNVIAATATTAGTPYTIGFSASGGGTVAVATTQANVSPSDVINPNNWLRGGNIGIPQSGDDVLLAQTAVPLLWNLDQLAAVRFNSFKRSQSFQGTVGLPVVNALGYLEYRPTYFQFSGPLLGILPLLLGEGQVGTGPSRERYNVGGQQVNLTILNSGSPADTYAVVFLGTNPQNTIRVLNTSLGIAVAPGDTAALASILVDGGGTLALGSGVQFASTSSTSGSSSAAAASPGVVTAYNATLILSAFPGQVVLDQGAQCFLQGYNGTYPSLYAQGASTFTVFSNAAVSTLVLAQSSAYDKSNDVQPQTIGGGQIDNDCQIVDPNNCLTYATPLTLNGAVSSGPFQFGRGRKVQVL